MKICSFNGKTYKDTFDCSHCISCDVETCQYELHNITQYTREEAEEVVKGRDIDVIGLMRDYINLREVYNVTKALFKA